MKRISSQQIAIRMAVVFFFAITILNPNSYAQPGVLSPPGQMIGLTPGIRPAVIKGIKVFAEKPLQMDFIIDAGDSGLDETSLKSESEDLIKYFLASLTIPEEDMWVNLSPYENNRVIPERFGQTIMGRELLAQDYILKQLTASLLYPEEDIGKTFWEKIYKKAQETYGTTDIPINTFNKVWIVPDLAKVYVNQDTAFIAQSHLKVMLEGDYLALKENLANEQFSMNELETQDAREVSNLSSDVVRELIIPQIEKEVNEGEHFAKLRQIYQAMILATWYKRNLKESFLGQHYASQGKVEGVNHDDPQAAEKIYKQYLEAFKIGVFDFIKEEYDSTTQQVTEKKYFSGGIITNFTFNAQSKYQELPMNDLATLVENPSGLYQVSANLESPLDKAMTAKANGSGFLSELKRVIFGGTGPQETSKFVPVSEIMADSPTKGAFTMEDRFKAVLIDIAVDIQKEAEKRSKQEWLLEQLTNLNKHKLFTGEEIQQLSSILSNNFGIRVKVNRHYDEREKQYIYGVVEGDGGDMTQNGFGFENMTNGLVGYRSPIQKKKFIYDAFSRWQNKYNIIPEYEKKDFTALESAFKKRITDKYPHIPLSNPGFRPSMIEITIYLLELLPEPLLKSEIVQQRLSGGINLSADRDQAARIAQYNEERKELGIQRTTFGLIDYIETFLHEFGHVIEPLLKNNTIFRKLFKNAISDLYALPALGFSAPIRKDYIGSIEEFIAETFMHYILHGEQMAEGFEGHVQNKALWQQIYASYRDNVFFGVEYRLQDGQLRAIKNSQTLTKGDNLNMTVLKTQAIIKSQTTDLPVVDQDSIKKKMIKEKFESEGRYLKTLRNNKVTPTAHIFDLEGDPRPLQAAIEGVRSGAIRRVVVHGDSFDRHDNNKGVFEAFKELKKLLGDEFILEFGNHDVFMIQALLLNDQKAAFDWVINGGDRFLAEYGIDDFNGYRAKYIEAMMKDEEEQKNLIKVIQEIMALYDKKYVNDREKMYELLLNYPKEALEMFDQFQKEFQTEDFEPFRQPYIEARKKKNEAQQQHYDVYQAFNPLYDKTFGNGKERLAELRQLATWILLQSRFYYRDDIGWGDVHAGFGIDQDGNPNWTGESLNVKEETLRQLQQDVLNNNEISAYNIQQIQLLFEEMNELFWIRPDKWVDILASDETKMSRFLDGLGIVGLRVGHERGTAVREYGGGRILFGDVGQEVIMLSTNDGIQQIKRQGRNFIWSPKPFIEKKRLEEMLIADRYRLAKMLEEKSEPSADGIVQKTDFVEANNELIKQNLPEIIKNTYLRPNYRIFANGYIDKQGEILAFEDTKNFRQIEAPLKTQVADGEAFRFRLDVNLADKYGQNFWGEKYQLVNDGSIPPDVLSQLNLTLQEANRKFNEEFILKRIEKQGYELEKFARYVINYESLPANDLSTQEKNIIDDYHAEWKNFDPDRPVVPGSFLNILTTYYTEFLENIKPERAKLLAEEDYKYWKIIQKTSSKSKIKPVLAPEKRIIIDLYHSQREAKNIEIGRLELFYKKTLESLNPRELAALNLTPGSKEAAILEDRKYTQILQKIGNDNTIYIQFIKAVARNYPVLLSDENFDQFDRIESLTLEDIKSYMLSEYKQGPTNELTENQKKFINLGVPDEELNATYKKYILKLNKLINGLNNLKDNAMLNEPQQETSEVGGIDLNPNALTIEQQGQILPFVIPEGYENIDASMLTGFTPDVFRIIPVTNLPILLGLEVKPANQQISSINDRPLFKEKCPDAASSEPTDTRALEVIPGCADLGTL